MTSVVPDSIADSTPTVTSIKSSEPVPSDDDYDDDRFFYYLIFIMPLIACAAYIYDAYTFFVYNDKSAGLLSSILFMFYFLQYTSSINSKLVLTIYHFLIWCMIVVGDTFYILYYLKQNDRMQQIRYTVFIFSDSIFCFTVWNCKMIVIFGKDDRSCRVKIFEYLNLNSDLKLHIKVRQKQFFGFISRLETLLATLIPIFFSDKIIQTTSVNVGFVILFDFFYESYYKFRSVWIKVCLHLFASIVTASVTTEWLYYVTLKPIYSQVSSILEFLASCCCCLFIIIQFFPNHFHIKYRRQ